MKRIDTCGMSCPQPVLMTKKAIEDKSSQLEVLVDNNTAKGNVTRFLETNGYRVSVSEEGENLLLKATK